MAIHRGWFKQNTQAPLVSGCLSGLAQVYELELSAIPVTLTVHGTLVRYHSFLLPCRGIAKSKKEVGNCLLILPSDAPWGKWIPEDSTVASPEAWRLVEKKNG